MPNVCYGQDGGKHGGSERRDTFVSNEKLKWMKYSHMETTLLICLIITCMLQQSNEDRAHKRKFTAACLLRDFINTVKNLPQSFSAVVIDGEALPIVDGSIRQLESSALTRVDAWPEFLSWWNGVRLDQIHLPSKVITNPVETASLGEVAAAMFLQAASLGSAELSTAGCEIVSQWVRAIVPNVKNIASQKPPEPKSERDLAQHGYYDWVLTEMREARPE
ncbi:unnamed protein product [Durusdinium trenchii]|uniref:Uncharacterized protein n=1 Tax=Durusdinium trenchii TaxID=1381693 RepID=A0ABP0J9J7_9DINO